MIGTAGMSYWEAFRSAFLILLIAMAILPWFNRNNTFVRTAAIALCLVLGWRYMLWRIFETIPAPDNPVDFLTGIVFVAVEAIAMLGTTA
jgi:cellulose synthase (UDP-forming)